MYLFSPVTSECSTTFVLKNGYNTLCICCCGRRWFEPLIDRWLAVTKTMALQRVRAAVDLGKKPPTQRTILNR